MRNPTPGAENAPHHGGHGSGPSADLLAQMSYETRDISLVALSRWLGVFVIFIIGSTFVSFLVFRFTVLLPLENEKHGLVAHTRVLPPFPQLQSDPKTDMMDYRDAEDQVLSGAGSGSTKPGVSIDAAIDAEATQHGIAGITGDATSWNYSTSAPAEDPSDKSYPGGGDYGASAAATKPTSAVSPAAEEPAPTVNTAAPDAVPALPATGAPAASPPASPAPNGNGMTP